MTVVHRLILILLLGHLSFFSSAQNPELLIYDTTMAVVQQGIPYNTSVNFRAGAVLADNTWLLGGESMSLVIFKDCGFDQRLHSDNLAPSDWTNDIHVEPAPENDIWIATINNGVWWIRVDSLGQHIDTSSITTSNTLSNLPTEIRSIATDTSGFVWFGHGLGVTRWNKGSLTALMDWRQYSTYDSLAGDQVTILVHDPFEDRIIAATTTGVSEYQSGVWYVLDSLRGLNIQDVDLDRNTGDVAFAEYKISGGVIVQKAGGNWDMIGSGSNPSKPLPGFYQEVKYLDSGRIMIGSITKGLAYFDGSDWKNYMLDSMNLEGNLVENIEADTLGNALVTVKNTIDQSYYLRHWRPGGIKWKVFFDSVKHNLCYGDSNGRAVASACLPSPPYTYSWGPPLNNSDTAFRNMPAGTYTVTISDTDTNMAYGSITIVEPDTALHVSAIRYYHPTTNTSEDARVAIDVEGGTKPYHIQWSDPLFQTGDSVHSMPSGVFQILITDANGCVHSDSAIVPWPLNINELDVNQPQISVWPNPALEHFDMRITGINSGDVMIQVFDVHGIRIKSFSRPSNGSDPTTARISTTFIQTGVYIVKAISENEMLTRRIIVSK